MHNKKGYILFLLFGILSVCSILISICFSHAIVYRQLVSLQIAQKKSQQLALSGIEIAQAIFNPKEEEKITKTVVDAQQKQPSSNETQKTEKLLEHIFPYLHKQKKFQLTNKQDQLDGTIELKIQSENGKLNLNSLYDFENKKFTNQGKENDSKKLCIWLFEKIEKITNKPNLMSSFENLLKKRSSEFNDPLELLASQEFQDQFKNSLYYDASEKDKKLFLTDIFTIYSESETIDPWFFSPSWLQLLDIKIKENLKKEDIEKILKNFKINPNWKEDWNVCFKGFYQKEYKDLPQEIKSILTTTFEANIFSLLVKAKVGETNSSIFTIIKANTKQHLTGFDIVKTSQI